MGFLDKLKDAKGKVEEKVTETVDKHGDKIGGAMDKAAGFVDDKTHGKYSDKIGTATDKAKGAVDKLGSDDPPAAGGQPHRADN